MKYISLCSGIEAASVAWRPLGWNPVLFSEIEKFPSQVLKHHFPDVPNLGDMTKLLNNQTFLDAICDLITAGTPCQSFSIAGLRNGLDSTNGNLALEFCRILLRKQPEWFVWENVPGVLSSFSGDEGEGIESSDFASILAGFQECGYSVAYRIFDSQYFGVPQRRRRVFVVGYFGNDWRPPTAVLFERESLRISYSERLAPSPCVSSLTRTDFKGPSKQRPNLVIPTSKGDRRLTPLECERLQGFPDNWTNIPGASDSARYMACGNSMTVNVMQWIGNRIDIVNMLK